MNPKAALESLKANPQEFLSQNLLVIAGGSKSGPRVFYIGYPMNPPTGVAAPNGAYNINITPFGLSNDVPDNSGMRYHAFNAHNVRMVPGGSYRFSNFELYNLGGGDTPEYMATGQLTGCSFVVAKEKGQLKVTHLQPESNGESLHASLERTKRLNQGDLNILKIFGKKDYDDRAYVIGLRRGGKWEFYGQCVLGVGKTARIQKVVKIH